MRRLSHFPGGRLTGYHRIMRFGTRLVGAVDRAMAAERRAAIARGEG